MILGDNMYKCLGHDCDHVEIYEYRILRAIWSNDINIEELEDADPRQYCALLADDGKAYAISVYDWWNKELIRKRENLGDGEIPVIVKPIEEMENYEVAVCNGGEEAFYYTFDKNELKDKLNSILKEKGKQKSLTKRTKNTTN